MEAITDPHAGIRSRGCQFGPWKLSEEGSNEQPHLNHDKVHCDASPRTRRKRLELILD